MKTLLFTCCLTIACAISFAQKSNFIRLQQSKLVDAAGNPITLHAVNTGGWLLWEGWIMGGGFTKETDIKSRLRLLLGNADYDTFLKNYYDGFIAENDISLMAKQGFNCIRLPLNYRLFNSDNADYENGFLIIDRFIKWCRQYHIYVILDLHAAPGGQSSYFIADPEKQNLWQSGENKAKTIALWKKIAARYKDESVIAGYDLLNEPNATKTETLISLYKDIIAGIRSVDANHLLIAEGNKSARIFSGFPLSLDDNQIYSFHYYSWFSEKNKLKAIQDILKSIPGNRPAWCGEWGEDTKANLAEVKQLLDKTGNSCGDAFWTWKRMYTNNSRYPFSSITATPSWKKIMTWVTWQLDKPNKETTDQGIREFLNAIKVQNCAVNQPF